ncbi:hypothetical protein QPK87_06995 [Kamptonema cortianum]|nr:hypothetical protein [Kamptonema cortianum]
MAMHKWAVLTVLVAFFALQGCREDPKPLSTGNSAASVEESASGSESPSGSDTAKTLNSGSGDSVRSDSEAGSKTLPPGETKNGKTAPAGRVFCDLCGGHMPKEDSVIIDGKTLCLADAEEYKAKKK